MKLSGSRIIIETLLEQGVDTVFGYPGGAIMPLYDALYDAPLRHILTVHEQGAAHAADGYARASGKVGVCIATSGPGATNLVTGLATAYMDSVPVVAITGQVGTTLLGRDAFQEIDITGLTMPITKHNFLVRSAADLAGVVRSAFAIAREGRPGPVLIDVPRDILLAEVDFASEQPALSQCPSSASSLQQFDDPQVAAAIEQAVTALLKSRRPVLIVGGGVVRAGASQSVKEFCEVYPLPVVSTLMGLGAIEPNQPYYLGLTGMHGHRAANLTVADADLIIAVGSRFSDRVTSDRSCYTKGKTIIHLDIDAAEIGKNVETAVMVIGELQHSLKNLSQRFRHAALPDHTDWLAQVSQWQEQHQTQTDTTVLNPVWIMQHLSTAVAALPVTWISDVGQHQMWAAQHLSVESPGTWLTSGGLGTMGFGLPAALGAQLSRPEQRAILIAGDGGFKMTAMELYTAAVEKVPVICVILDNSALGMVRQWQQLFFNKRYSATTLPAFDFIRLANSCGVDGIVANTPAEFSAGFQQALASDSPFILVAKISPDCLVDPMVQPGQAVNRFVEMS
jgi:acetolactate synthase-1/2/3 large subunit